MKILVANLGSTSFKYRLFDMSDQRQLARGSVERIGEAQSRSQVSIGEHSAETQLPIPDHAVAVQQCLEQLTDSKVGCLKDAAEVSAIGLKAVHGGRFSGVQQVTADVLEAMEEMNAVAPAHNPPYINAMRLLAEQLPEIPLVAVFETGFHDTIPERNRRYAVPHEWATEYGIKRYGFHGASHEYIAQRLAKLLGRDDLRVISCHLGGSSSLCASRAGKSVATTMGMSPQSGLPQNNRVGDFDPFALLRVMAKSSQSLDEVLQQLANRSGLLGISGVGGDIRDIQAAADQGNEQAQLALDVYVGAIRHYLGAYLVELGGADAIVFTGGIGENRSEIRAQVCEGLQELGIELDVSANESPGEEKQVSFSESRVAVWVVPTNEEIIVAQKTAALLGNASS